MKKLLYFSVFFAAFALTSCSLFNAGNNQSDKGVAMYEFKLPNQMNVVIFENNYSKTVAMDIWVNTGSKDEPAAISGVSHFLEHMLFKGTDTKKPGEIDGLIEGVGGSWNAGTSNDFTHFYLTVPDDQFDRGLDVLSDIIMNAKIDQEEFDKEKPVILEEFLRKQDNPMGYLYENIFTETYKSGGYERTVLGTKETITAITRDEMYKYYKERYIPKNMIFIISGNVKVDDIKPKIEKTFASFTRGADFVVPDTGEAVQEFGITKEYKKQVKDTYMAITYPAPGIKNPVDSIVLDLLTTILSDGRSSRFFREIKENKQLVSNISGSYPTLKGNSLFSVFATLKNEKSDEVIKAVTEEIKKVADNSVSSDELKKAKKIIKNSFVFGRETNTGRTQSIGYFYTLTGSTQYEKEYLETLEKISAADIKKMAEKIVSGKMNVFKIVPEEAK